jgi:hypothetical protein
MTTSSASVVYTRSFARDHSAMEEGVCGKRAHIDPTCGIELLSFDEIG